MPRFSTASIPWWMFDLDNKQLLTSRIVPGDITDDKKIVLVESPIPGLNYEPIMPAGGGNRKVSFMLPVVMRNAVVGNVLLLKQFDLLRNQARGLFNFGQAKKFTRAPQVLYSWGIGSVPLVYFVSGARMVHKQGWINARGQPQYTEVEIELTLDEENPLYKVEEAWRMAAAVMGMAAQVGQAVAAVLGKRPY
jgi:hypothetical protein